MTTTAAGTSETGRGKGRCSRCRRLARTSQAGFPLKTWSTTWWQQNLIVRLSWDIFLTTTESCTGHWAGPPQLIEACRLCSPHSAERASRLCRQKSERKSRSEFSLRFALCRGNWRLTQPLNFELRQILETTNWNGGKKFILAWINLVLWSCKS